MVYAVIFWSVIIFNTVMRAAFTGCFLLFNYSSAKFYMTVRYYAKNRRRNFSVGIIHSFLFPNHL